MYTVQQYALGIHRQKHRHIKGENYGIFKRNPRKTTGS
jgi:hypothetical protein